MATLPLIQAQPLDMLLGVIPSLPRPVLARLTARLIERLDDIDGDADLEDATDLEDEGLSRFGRAWARQAGPGCPIADEGEEPGDLEAIDEREPENFEGGYGETGSGSHPYSWQPHPDVRRIKRLLRARR